MTKSDTTSLCGDARVVRNAKGSERSESRAIAARGITWTDFVRLPVRHTPHTNTLTHPFTMPPPTSLSTASRLVAPVCRHSPPVASSSRVQLRSVHSSAPCQSNGWQRLADVVSKGAPGTNDGAGSLGDRPGAGRWGTPRGPDSGNRTPGANPFTVPTSAMNTPRPSLSGGASTARLRKPVQGQVCIVWSITWQ